MAKKAQALVKVREWKLGKSAAAAWNGSSLTITSGKDEIVVTLSRSETRKLYRRLSSLYRD